MRRWALNILTVAAFALCGITVGLWIWSSGDTRFLRSNFFRGRFDGDREWRGDYLACSRGQLAFELEEITYATPPTSAPVNRWRAEDAVGVRTATLRSFPFDGPLGFHFLHDRAEGEAGSARVIRLALPFWAILLASSLPILVRLGQRLRRRANTLGGLCRCPACGYDLRATPDRCPECGTIPGPVRSQ